MSKSDNGARRPSARECNRALAIPKPSAPSYEHYLGLTGHELKVSPEERDVFAHLVNTGDMLEVDGRLWLLAPVPRHMRETLELFGARTEDLEPDDLPEADTADLESNGDEGDCSGADDDHYGGGSLAHYAMAAHAPVREIPASLLHLVKQERSNG